MDIKYYLIHGVDTNRKNKMINEFLRVGIDPNEVKWVLHPNKDELDADLIEKFFDKNIQLRTGQMSCTYKHYLALEDIVKNKYPYAVIMEDNIVFKSNVKNIKPILNECILQLNASNPNWDVVFDSDNLGYIESFFIPGCIAHPKTNEVTSQCHGGTRYARFYLLTLACATKLYNNYLPIETVVDFWMNDLFRRLNIKSFWTEPAYTTLEPYHHSTAL